MLQTRLLILMLLVTCAISGHKHKRQIYREQLSPRLGGKIPDAAFSLDRLHFNRFDAQGLSVPDGLLIQARPNNIVPVEEDPEDLQSILKLPRPDDGRFVAPSGQGTLDGDKVDSTYLIRPHVEPPFANIRLVPIFDPLQGSRFRGRFPGSGISPDVIYNRHGRNEDLSLSESAGRFGKKGRRQRGGRIRLLDPALPSNPHNIQAGVQVSGTPGKDYPIHSDVPQTNFDCDNVPYKPKMYPDKEVGCQVFHYCQEDGRQDSFLCPAGTLFDQNTDICDWWQNVSCT